MPSSESPAQTRHNSAVGGLGKHCRTTEVIPASISLHLASPQVPLQGLNVRMGRGEAGRLLQGRKSLCAWHWSLCCIGFRRWVLHWTARLPLHPAVCPSQAGAEAATPAQAGYPLPRLGLSQSPKRPFMHLQLPHTSTTKTNDRKGICNYFTAIKTWISHLAAWQYGKIMLGLPVLPSAQQRWWWKAEQNGLPYQLPVLPCRWIHLSSWDD